MKLHELKEMVKVEFDKFLKEEEEGAEEVSVAVDGEEEGGDDDVLRQIYDLLAAHFEGGEEDIEMDDMEDMEDLGGEEEEVEDVEGEEDEDADLEEIKNNGFGGSPAGKNAGGKNGGYTKSVKEGKKKKKDVLQERFQKLANII